MLPILAESGRGRMWPSWYVAVPVGLFLLALFLTIVPIVRKPPDAHEPEPTRTGMKLRPGSTTKLGQANIRKQDIGIDLEGGELTVDDLDVE